VAGPWRDAPPPVRLLGNGRAGPGRAGLHGWARLGWAGLPQGRAARLACSASNSRASPAP